MEATTLQKKKNAISKGKLKKNIKNVLCRPDQLFWPEVTDDQQKKLATAIKQYSVTIPPFKKLHWKELKLIPKDKRPKPPKIRKVDGLLFGISECSNAIQDGQCSGIIVETNINPRMIIQPVIEMCTSKDIPLLCMTDLRNLTLSCFGIKTSCLGLRHESLIDLRKEILDITKLHPKPNLNIPENQKKIVVNKNQDVDMEIQEKKTDSNKMDLSESPYLYRSNKKTRVFIPTGQENKQNTVEKFIGQDFIEFSQKADNEQNGNKYIKLILKRISNNPNRVKKK